MTELQDVIAAANAEPDEDLEAEGEGEEETEPEPEPEPELEPSAAQMSEKEREKIIGRLDAENDRHTKRVAEILGPDVTDLEPCTFCWEHAAGFLLAGVEIDVVQAAMTRQRMGMGPEPTYKSNPTFAPCPTCDGMGRVLSGSRVEAQITQPCPECVDKGWIRVTPPPPNTPGHAAPTNEPPPVGWVPPNAPLPPQLVWDHGLQNWRMP